MAESDASKRGTRRPRTAAILTDDHGRVTAWSAAAEALTGLSAAEMIGQPAWEICTRLLPPGQEPEAVRRRVRTMVELALSSGRGPATGEHKIFRMVRRDGRQLTIEHDVAMVPTDGGASHGMVAIVHETDEADGTGDGAQAPQESQHGGGDNAWDRLLFDESSNGIALHEIICDESGAPVDYRFLDINPAFEKMTGLRADVVIGRTAREVIPNLEWTWIERYGRVALTGHSDEFESYNAAIGRHFLVKAYRPREGQFAVVFSDVTELRERTSFAETIISSSGEGIVVFDRDLRYVVFNPVIENLTGMDAADVLGRDPEDVFPWFRAMPLKDRLQRALAGEVTSGAEFEVVSVRTGVRSRVLVTYQPHRDLRGEIIGVVGSIRDITARHAAEQALRLSEEHFRAIFDNAGDAIAIYRPDGTIVEANRLLCERLGYSHEELLAMTVAQLDAPESAALLKDRVAQVMSGGTPQFEVIHVSSDGTRIPVEVVSRRIDFRGEPAVLTVQRDITDRKRAEAERTALEDQLRQAQKMEGIGRLAGGIAHDFNNLLTIIRGNATLAKAALPLGHESREDLEQIEQAADRAAALTRQLLAFARRTVLKPEAVDLAAVLKRLDPMLSRLLGEDVEIVTTTPSTPVMVMADPSQIEQVIVNLAVNARDAMPDGGKLTIQAAAVDHDEVAATSASPAARVREGRGATLTVTDTGMGMDDEVMLHLFEPFFTTKPPGKGTGLGLATVYGIVEQSGGTVWADSKPGSGTRMTVWLPLIEDQVAVPAVSPVIAETHVGRTGTILVVEDDEGVCRFATQVLSRAGYTVVAAASGAAALETVGAIRPDVLLTDVIMPTMNGREVANRMQARQPGLRVVFMSGYADSAIVKHGVLDEEIRYLPKPFSADALLDTIHEALESADS
jgi:two-component system, cell cycle sensor histidine kinase and response regulator CckA